VRGAIANASTAYRRLQYLTVPDVDGLRELNKASVRMKKYISGKATNNS
jgi:hypothetical protein